jgi:hypothetical protein
MFGGLSDSQRTILGLAALSDAFGSMAGRPGNAMQQFAPVARDAGWNDFLNSQLPQPGGAPAMPAPSGAAAPAALPAPVGPGATAPAVQPAEPPRSPAGTLLEEGGDFSPAAIGRALDRLERAESSRNPRAVNAQGFAGLYQIGAPLALDAGVYQPAPGEIQNGRWNGQWGGTFNIPGHSDVRTLEDFLNNPAAQRRAAELGMSLNAGRLTGMGLPGLIGQEVDGVRITPEALLQGAWLGGPGGVERFVRGGQDRADANGTPVSRWMRLGQDEPEARAVAGGPAASNANAALLTPQQQAIAGTPQPAPAPQAPQAQAPGQQIRPRGFQMTPELVEMLRRMGPEAGAMFLAQQQARAAQGPVILSDAEAQALLGPRFDPENAYQITSEGIRTVPGTLETRSRNRQIESDLRSEFRQLQPVRDFMALTPAIREIEAAATRENPTRINDINLVFAYAKMLDPASVVREGEQIMITRSGGPIEALRGMINGLNGGATIAPETRSSILTEARSRFASARDAFELFANEYRELATDMGVDPNRVVRPLRGAEPPQRAVPGQPGILPRPAPEQPISAADQMLAVSNLRERVNSGSVTREQAIAAARSLGVPNPESMF